MTTEIFFPGGTVRRRFAQLGSSPTPQLSLDEFLGAIALIASEEQFEPELVWTARRLVLSEVGLDDVARRRAALAVLVLLITSGEGSTRVPLESPNYVEVVLQRITARLEAYGRSLDEERNPAAAIVAQAARAMAGISAGDVQGILASGKLATLVGKVKGDEVPYRPIVVGEDGSFYTSERLLRKENALGDALQKLASGELEGANARDVEDALATLAAMPTYYEVGAHHEGAQMLNAEQLQAVRIAATRPLTLVTGGPGTGKTTIVVSILRVLTRLGVAPERIALAAPTGKAAHRMRESIDGQLASLSASGRRIAEPDRGLREGLGDARTLHRLLGYSPRYDFFRKGKKDPIEADVVICDESSMIDLDLMHALIEALAVGARLILVGDADQLPAVAGGAVFRDLVASLSTCTGRLEKSYRMDDADPHGKSILEFAAAVRTCDRPDAPRLARGLGDELSVEDVFRNGGVRRLAPETTIEAFARAWFDAHIVASDAAPQAFERLDGGFDEASTSHLDRWFKHYAKARILCVTRVFKTGAVRLNTLLHRLFLDHHQRGSKQPFAHLEPVLFLHNNYELGLFNGDQGLVARVKDGLTGRSILQVVFPRQDGTFRAVPLSQIRHQIELAFAMSVHKSQGSEFKDIAVVLPEEPIAMLTKELLYTALTRASKSVTIFDAQNVLPTGAARPVQRFTGLETRVGPGHLRARLLYS